MSSIEHSHESRSREIPAAKDLDELKLPPGAIEAPAADIARRSIFDIQPTLRAIAEKAAPNMSPGLKAQMEFAGLIESMDRDKFVALKQGLEKLPDVTRVYEQEHAAVTGLEARIKELRGNLDSAWHRTWAGAAKLGEEKAALERDEKSLAEKSALFEKAKESFEELSSRAELVAEFCETEQGPVKLTAMGAAISVDVAARPSAYQGLTLAQSRMVYEGWEELLSNYDKAYQALRYQEAAVELACAAALADRDISEVTADYERAYKQIGWSKGAMQIASAATAADVECEAIIADYKKIYGSGQAQIPSSESAVKIACAAAKTAKPAEEIVADFRQIYGGGPGQIQDWKSAITIACTSARLGVPPGDIVAGFREAFGSGPGQIQSWRSAVEIACNSAATKRPIAELVDEFRRGYGSGQGQNQSWDSAVKVACASASTGRPVSEINESFGAAYARLRSWKPAVQMACVAARMRKINQGDFEILERYEAGLQD